MKTIDLIAFIIFDLLALGGGVGIAILFERYRAMKKLQTSSTPSTPSEE